MTPWTIQSWNSPGQNTGVSSCSLLQGIFPTQGSNPGLVCIAGRFFFLPAELLGKLSLCHFRCFYFFVASTRLLCPWNAPGKNIGVGCHFLLQGNILTQGSNPGLLHCTQMLYRLNHQGNTLHTFTYGFFRGSVLCLCLSFSPHSCRDLTDYHCHEESFSVSSPDLSPEF